MDAESRKNMEQIEKTSRFPTGAGKIDRGECELGSLNPMACMFCSFGHMLECHYPHTCSQAECSHYQRESEAIF
jgi:hypothetical protein